MEESSFTSTLFYYVKFLGLFHTKEKPMPAGKIHLERDEFYLKEISKEGVQKLIERGFLKNTGNGYVNPKKDYRVGYYKTCGGHRYIEDWYADKAKQLR